MKSTGRWASVVSALVLAGAGAVLCFVPLFNILGYESSLALAILGSLVAVRQGTLVIQRARARKIGPPPALWRLYLRGLFAAVAFLLLPLILLLFNGLRIRNCSYVAGLQFFIMMPVLSVACAVAVGQVAALCTKTTARALLSAYSVLGLSALWSLLRFLNTPAIFAHDPFFGYFPGALYDEEVALHAGFFWARTLHLLCFLAVFAALSAWLSGNGDGDGQKLQVRRWRRPPRKAPLFLAVLFGAAALLLYLQGGRLGIYTDVATLSRHLYKEARVEVGTGHILLRYRPGGPVARDLPLLMREHALRYAQLRDLLGVEPDWRSGGGWGWLKRRVGLEPDSSALLTSYLFDSTLDKQRLTGAGHTFIAKPWRREIYLQYEPWPHPVLRHEMAHVFAGVAGDRLLRLATHYGLPRPGMIEGFAVAADFAAVGELGGHQVVLAMRRAGLEAPLEQIFDGGLGFWRLPGNRAYAIAGSFCRYLLDRYGAAPLLQTYQRGGAPDDFATAFGVPFATLAADWRHFIDEQPLKPESQEVARDRMRRQAVFHKVCAHELALRKQAAHIALKNGDSAEAVRLLTAVCSDDPDEPQHRAELLEVLLAGQQFDAAENVAQTLLQHSQRTAVLEAWTAGHLGDLAVLRGDLEAARSAYERALAGPQAESANRLLTAKLIALSSAQAGSLLLQMLVGTPAQPGAQAKSRYPQRLRERNDAVSTYILLQAVEAESTLSLSHYLLGRLLMDRGGYVEADKELARAYELGLPDDRFTEQCLLLRGQAALLSGRAHQAEALFGELLGRIKEVEQGKRLLAEDMRDRARRWPELEKAEQSP